MANEFLGCIENACTDASASAQSALESKQAINKRYLGAFNVPPSVDGNGDALEDGAMYFDSASNLMKFWGDNSWHNAPDTIQSMVSNVSISSGFDPIYPTYKNQDIITNKAGCSVLFKGIGNEVELKKDSTTGSNTWYGFHIKIPYANLNELDKDFLLGLNVIAGEAPNSFKIIKNPTDWNPNSYPVDISNSIKTGEPFNLFDEIMDSPYATDYKNDLHAIYILVALYTNNATANDNAVSTWGITPRFLSGNVRATELDKKLKLNGLVNSSLNDVEIKEAVERGHELQDDGKIISIASPLYPIIDGIDGYAIPIAGNGNGVTLNFKGALEPFEVVKEVTTGSSIFAGIYLKIPYTDLSELDRAFFIDIVQNGDTITNIKILDKQLDWNPNNHPISLSVGMFDSSINLYEKIVEAGLESNYLSKSALYILITKYSSDTSVIDNAVFTWKINPYFEKNRPTIANKLSKELNNSIINAIDSSTNDVSKYYRIDKEKYISNGTGNGDSDNSTILVTPKNDLIGDIVGYNVVGSYSGTSYLYSWHKISSNYADVQNKKFIFDVASEATSSTVKIRLINSPNWGNGIIYSTAISILEENNFSTSFELDMSLQAIQDYYATEGRGQNVIVAFVFEGQEATDFNFYHSYHDSTNLEFTLEEQSKIPIIDRQYKDIEQLKLKESSTEFWAKNNLSLPVSKEQVIKVHSYTTLEYDADDTSFDSRFIFEKPATTGEHGTWYGVWIEIPYKNLEELNKNFSIYYNKISGYDANAFRIVNRKGDWNPAHNPIFFSLNTANNCNLYDLIENANLLAEYEALDRLYIIVANYVGSNDVNDYSSKWSLSPYFERTGARFTANKLSVDLEKDLNSKIESAGATDITNIVCWGDSLTAMGGWTTKLQELSGLPVRNAGTGGENSQTIMARQGGDVMITNNITIPADTSDVLIADRDVDGGISTQFGNKVTPLYQGGSGHINPAVISGIEGTLRWTGSSYADTTGNWVWHRNTAGDEVVINRPTSIVTKYDRLYNNSKTAMVIFIGQNGGWHGIDDLILQHKRMIEHSGIPRRNIIILGLSSQSAAYRASYEEAMRNEFGRNFISIREYLAHPIYDENNNIVNCYGLEDQGATPTQDDLDDIAEGLVCQQLRKDSVHYTPATRTVVGEMLYRKMTELGILKQGGE